MRRRFFKVVGLSAGLTALAALVSAGLVMAAGGDTIATAPRLEAGDVEQGTTPSAGKVAWYTVAIEQGDILQIGWGNPTGSKDIIGMCLLPAGTDDFRATQNACLIPPPLKDTSAAHSTGYFETAARLQYDWPALPAGLYPIAVMDQGCLGSGPRLHLPCGYPNGPAVGPFVLRVNIRSLTTIAIKAPKTARVGRPVSFVIRLAGKRVQRGTVALQVRKGARWSSVATASVSSGQAVRLRWTPTVGGRARVRAYYPGNGTNQPATAETAVRVS